MIVANQKGTARPIFSESCVVGVKVYGSSPSMFREIRNSIRDARSSAHLCPGTFTGRSSSWVNRPINQFCRVSSRLFSHRSVGVGKRIQGSVRARAIRGMPR